MVEIGKYPEILDWFFGYFSIKNPPFEEQLYVYMKRFHTQPSEFYKMDRLLRLKLYTRERELIEHENKRVNELNNPQAQ